MPGGNDRQVVGVYNELIKSIDVVLQNLSNPQQSMTKKLNMNSYPSTGGGGGGNDDGGDEEEPSKPTSWSPW